MSAGGTLLRHPAVAEVAIVGVPSERWGETPHAFVDELPKTATGKIQKFVLRGGANLSRQ
jgi:fatty-acyl-CoA synthase